MGWTLILPGTIGLLLAGMLWLVSNNPPLVMIEAQTGFISYRVQRQDVSAMALEGAEVTEVAAFCVAGLDAEGRVSAIIMPPVGATVEYHWLPGMVMIRLSALPGGSTLVENAEGQQCHASTELTILVSSDVLDRSASLPVLGAGQIGVEQGVPTLSNPMDPCVSPQFAGRFCIHNGSHEIPVEPASNPTLRSATARMFGRTSMLFSGGQLYPITDGDFAIPGGGRLEAVRNSAPFIGSVTLDDTAKALRAQVTIEADSLRLFRVGQSGQAELLATGMVARAINDPSMWPILMFVAIIAFLLQVAIGAHGFVKDALGEE